MTITISISDLRKNIATYIEKASNGVNVVIRDEKRDIDVAQITGTKSFNKNDYEAVLRSSAGVLSDRHIEWKDRKSINKWLSDTRSDSDREVKS